MRLSLWQQFSSNHSAYFTIVGIYPSSEAAKHASEQVNTVLKSIEAWHETYRDEAEALWVKRQISDFEQAIGRQYHIDWNQAVLWNGYKLMLYNQILVISSRRQSDSGAAPIHKLMESLGGDVVVNGDIYGLHDVFTGQIAIEMECLAPSESVAAEIAEATGGEKHQKTITIGLDSDETPNLHGDLERILALLKNNNCTIQAIWSSQSRRHWLHSDR